MNPFDAAETAYRNGFEAGQTALLDGISETLIKKYTPVNPEPLTKLLIDVGIKDPKLARAVAESFLKKYAPVHITKKLSDANPSDEFICEHCGTIIKECSGYDEEDDVYYELPYRYCPKCGYEVTYG